MGKRHQKLKVKRFEQVNNFITIQTKSLNREKVLIQTSRY